MLEPVAEGVWRAQMRFQVAPAFALPAAATVLARADGSLAVISPVVFDEETAAQVDALGPVSALVAPNRFHHLALPAAMARWPKAKVFAAPTLPKKRPDIRFDAELSDGSGLLEPDLSAHLVAGAPFFNEVLLLHRPSRTLVVTDLFLNVHGRDGGWLAALYLKASGAQDRPGMSVWWRFLVKDRGATAAALGRVLATDFVRVVPSHGEPLLEDAKAAFTRAVARCLTP